jgi:hypothetical protein
VSIATSKFPQSRAGIDAQSQSTLPRPPTGQPNQPRLGRLQTGPSDSTMSSVSIQIQIQNILQYSMFCLYHAVTVVYNVPCTSTLPISFKATQLREVNISTPAAPLRSRERRRPTCSSSRALCASASSCAAASSAAWLCCTDTDTGVIDVQEETAARCVQDLLAYLPLAPSFSP